MDDKFVVSTAGKSAGKTAAVGGVVSAATIVTLIGVIRAFWPEYIWTPEHDGEVADKIAAAVSTIVAAGAAIGWIWGLVTNIYKNWERVRNGVKLTKDSEVAFDFAPKE